MYTPEENREYLEWLNSVKWICECGLQFFDMIKAEDHQAETDHCMERVKRDSFDDLIKSHGL